MDDWSLLPRRNAVSEPAPNPQSPMTADNLLPDSPDRVKRQPAPISHAREPQRLTRPASPGNRTHKPGQSPETTTTTGLTVSQPSANAPARQ
jgi:hypothetical protein